MPPNESKIPVVAVIPAMRSPAFHPLLQTADKPPSHPHDRADIDTGIFRR